VMRASVLFICASSLVDFCRSPVSQAAHSKASSESSSLESRLGSSRHSSY
jgi:hypothetical protein